MLNNKKSKIVGDKLLTKVIELIQVRLMDLGDVTYDIKRELSPTVAYEEHLIVILYDRNNFQNCVWTSIDMDVVLRLASNDNEFIVKELIDPTILKLRHAFEALKDGNLIK